MTEIPPGGDPDAEDDGGDVGELLRQIATAPSIDPSTLGRGAKHTSGLLPGAQLGHFRILERIGEGGMGVVYRAEDERLRRKVALKVLPPHQVFDRERRRRLWREAQSAAAVNHPNIAAIFELGDDDTGAVFIAMELLDGVPLRRRIQGGPMPPLEALAVAGQVAQGLERAHEAGIVHRDLKPENVMVLLDRTVKVLDFGLAKLRAGPEERVPPSAPADGAGSAATKDGQVVGTPRYMAPEQKRGETVDARADIYAFGVMLSEMLLGRWAPEEERAPEPLRRRAAPLEAKLGDRERALLEELLLLAGECMQEAREARFSDGRALRAALRDIELRHDPFASFSAEPRSRVPAWLWGVAILGAVSAAAALVSPRLAGRREPPTFRVAEAPRIVERRLTANPRDNPVLDAALSPDGRSLAYVDRSGLFIRGVDSPSTAPVPFAEGVSPQWVSWFPGGAELLIATPAADELTQLWRVGREGKAKKLAAGHFRRPQVSPDGRRVAWIDAKGIAVGVVDAERERGRIAAPAGPADELDELSWSPDGRRLAFLRVRRGEAGVHARLETAGADSGAPVLVLEDPRLVQEGGGGAVTWAGDGRIVFALAERPPRETGFTLWAIPVDPDTGAGAGQPRPIASWTGSTPGLLTSGGGALAYSRTESQSDVYVADLADEGSRLLHPHRLTLSDRNERPSGWTPDSRSVLFTSDQDRSDDLFAEDILTSAMRRLVDTRPAQTWPVLWDDGKQLLYWEHPYSAQDTELHRALLMRADASAPNNPVKLLETRFSCDHAGGDLPPVAARFRCTSRGACVLGEHDGPALILSSLDPRTGEQKELLRVDDPGRAGSGWDLSPDGARVALPGAQGQLQVVELASGKSTVRFVQHGCALEHVAWSPDGNGLYATGVCPGDRPYQLLYTELYRQPHLLWDSSSTWFGLPEVSPDGKHLAFEVRPYDNDVWLATGF